MTDRQLVFDIERPKLLSSNVQPKHFTVKSRLVADLRALAIEAGITEHAPETQKLVRKHVELLLDERAARAEKSRIRKRMKGSPEEEIIEATKHLDERASFKRSSALEIPYLYDRVKIQVLVGAPTKRRFDPPNFWPTLKALTDGLTDCAWWEDDDFSHIVEIGFGLGPSSDKKNCFRFTVNFEEL